MTESKHTPGPWWIEESGVRDRGGYICHTRPAQRYPGQEDRFIKETAERAANKALIAAAPDLLEALQESVQLFELQSQMHRLVSRRAKGMHGIAVDDDGLAIEWQYLRALAECMIERRDEAIDKATGNLKKDGLIW